MKRFIGRFALFVWSFLLTLVCLEIFLNVTLYKPKQVWWQWVTSPTNYKFNLDSRRIYTLRRNHTVDYEPNVPKQTIDALGHRASPCSKGHEVWVFVGDSYIYGHGVGDMETIPHYSYMGLLDKGKQICVINVGVQGYALGTSYSAFLDALSFKPRVVIWGIRSDDLLDRIQNNVLDITSDTVHQRFWIFNGIYMQGIIQRTVGQLFPASRLLNIIMYTLQADMISNDYVDSWAEKFPVFVSHVDALAKKHGFKLYYVLTASETMMIDPENNQKYEVRINKLIVNTLINKREKYVDMNRIIRGDSIAPGAKNVSNLDIKKLFLPDWHMTPEGNKLVADTLIGLVEYQQSSTHE